MIEDAEMHGMGIYQPAAIALTRGLGLDITSQRERHDTGDIELTGAILADIGEPLAADTIASALGWTVDRVLDAAGELRTELRRVGQTATISASHDLALASHADGISDEIRADLHAARVRIDDTVAALLNRIITGRHEDRLVSTLSDKERTIATQTRSRPRRKADARSRPPARRPAGAAACAPRRRAFAARSMTGSATPPPKGGQVPPRPSIS